MHKQSVQVSVVIPVFNAGYKLHNCMQSILAQTEQSWEVIVINDGSTDESGSICSYYASLDDRIVIIEQQRRGSIAARRKGIELVTSPYITFLDADDWMEPTMLERLLQTIKDYEADIAASNSYRVLNDFAWPKRFNTSHYFQQEKVYRGTSIRDELVTSFIYGHDFPASLHGKLYRTELARKSGAYLQHLTFFGDDLYFNMEMFLLSNTVTLIPEPLYYYRAGGMTSRYMPELLQQIISGYRIQRLVIDHYYPTAAKEDNYIGSNVMLLNTLPTCLRNLFLGGLSQEERHSQIVAMCNHPEVKSCAHHEPSAKHVNQRLVRAILMGDISYLDRLGHVKFMKQRLKNWILHPLYAIDSSKFDKLRNNFLKSEDTKRQYLRSR
ncbi:glycosyltransferase family 2 protein [Paenibacillus sp. strain BS8-2]